MKTVHVTLANGEKVPLREFVPGRLRLTIDDRRFGQIKREGADWKAEVRDADTGVILRYAGIWKTRREAVAELIDFKNGETQPFIFRRISRSAHSVDEHIEQ